MQQFVVEESDEENEEDEVMEDEDFNSDEDFQEDEGEYETPGAEPVQEGVSAWDLLGESFLIEAS